MSQKQIFKKIFLKKIASYHHRYTKHVLKATGLFETIDCALPYNTVLEIIASQRENEVITYGSTSLR